MEKSFVRLFYPSFLSSRMVVVGGGGGVDLLHCIPNTKNLDVISPSVAQSAKLLRAAVGNGRVDVRPIQKN